MSSKYKAKAKELIQEFYPNVQWKLGQEDCLDRAKRCALITVNEIIKNNLEYLRDVGLHNDAALNIDLSYWKEVKHEIENYEL